MRAGIVRALHTFSHDAEYALANAMRSISRRVSRQVLYTAGLLVILLIFALSMFSILKVFFFVSLFIVLHVVGALYRRYMQLPVSMEFALFGTVLVSAAYGTSAGLAVALMAPLVAALNNGDFSPYTIVTMMIYVLVAAITPHLPLSIVLVGIIMALAKNILVTLVFQLVFQYDLAKNLAYFFTDMVLNLLLFSRVAPPLMQLMK